MSIDLARFIQIRPYLYHLTARSNLVRIVQKWRIDSAQSTLEQAKDTHVRSDKRRPNEETVQTQTGVVTLRDQAPLHSGSIVFEDGWDPDRFVSHVNKHVFTWPGTEKGPISSGLNHFARYKHQGPVLIRFSTADAAAAKSPKFCRYNSGAPRCVGGKRSPRGSSTYVAAAVFDGTASDVVEVVFERSIPLPSHVEFADTYAGPWRKLNIANQNFLQADALPAACVRTSATCSNA